MAAIILSVAKKHGRRHSVTNGHGGSFKGHNSIEDYEDVNKDPTGDEVPLARVQRLIRERLVYKNRRLHREYLAERLNFESATTLGLFRFLNQLMVFALFVAALSFSSNQEATRGILQTLNAEFDFGSISDVEERDQFVQESMVALSQKSKEFFILSTKYFDDQGIGSTQLIKDITEFDGPKLSTPVSLHVLEFSFTAWVKVVPQYVEGYILRKRLVADGSAASLSCWGWHLSATAGAAFHFGCHDFFDAQSDDRQVHVGLASPTPFDADQFVMLTLVVDQHRAHFYRDIAYLGAAPLPRPVTDCFNDGEGLLVGAGGMQLGLVRFHPRALTLSSIEELFTGGSTLAEISTGSEPLAPEPEGLKTTERSLAATMVGVYDAVSARQEQSEVTMVLNRVTEERANPPAPPTGTPPEPADAPLGQIRAASSAVTDGVTGRDYYSLALGPWRLSPTYEEADHRSIVGLPDASGTGFTMTWWYRHIPCDKSTCGMYLFSVRDSERICYAVWLETVALWFENALGTPNFQYPHNFVDAKFQLNDDFNWRHLALVWDETDDQVRFYIDGIFAVSGPWGSAVSGADCTAGGKYMTFGRYGPNDYTYGGDVDIYDFRQYVHSSGGALSAEEILTLASEETPALNAARKCLDIESPLMADTAWRDTYGHDCEWFFKNKEQFPALCELSDTTKECPVACASRQQCLSTDPDPPMFLTWDRVRRIDAAGDNGTVCLASHLKPDQVRRECEEWEREYRRIHGDMSTVSEDLAGWADSILNTRRGRRVNITSCEELMASIDPECSFDEKAVKDFTKAVAEGGGDWTISFWIRPTGDKSKIAELGRFYPHVQFLGSLSPPQHNLAVGLWANPFGEARVFSACDRAERDIYDNIETSAADDEGWTLISIARKNANAALNKSGDATVVTNIARNWEGSQLTQCLYDPLMFMNAIEVNYPSLISPIMMIPKALPLAKIQENYYQAADAIIPRTGPIVSNNQRVRGAGIEIDKKDYSPRSILMAPPIIFQTKTRPAEECPFSYSTTLIEEEHRKMSQLRCSAPFSCTQDILSDKFLLYACPGPRVTEEESRVFGLEPKKFNGQQGYADFLYSIVDHPLLSRDSTLRFTEDFIDSRTEIAQVILVFFTPDAGTTSVMTVTADFSGFAAASVDVDLQHYEILEGEAKWTYLALQVLVMVNITLMALDIFVNFKGMVQTFRRTKQMPSPFEVVKQLVDFGTIGMVVAFIVLRIPQKFETAPETARIVGGLASIPWDSVDVGLEEKKSFFFELSTDLLNLIAWEQNLNKFCNVILLVSLLRVVQCTSLHPRLALLTGTMAKAIDDIWHSCILVVLLMGCFAGVASWRFGSTREDFGNFELTMQTQFEMLFGEFPDHWTESRDMQAYTVLYIMIMFLLIQNFLLAIIVEAYMKVREVNEKLKTHQEITRDVIGCLGAYLSSWTHGWPTPGKMGRVIREWEAKFSVGFKEIYGTGLFKSQESAGAWVDFYHAYEFLQPEEMGRFGFEKEGESQEDKIETRLARVIGKELPLRELAEHAIASSRLSARPAPRHLAVVPNGNGIAVTNGNGAAVASGNGTGQPHLAKGNGARLPRMNLKASAQPVVMSGPPEVWRRSEDAPSPPMVSAAVVYEHEAEQRATVDIEELQRQVAELQRTNARLHFEIAARDAEPSMEAPSALAALPAHPSPLSSSSNLHRSKNGSAGSFYQGVYQDPPSGVKSRFRS